MIQVQYIIILMPVSVHTSTIRPSLPPGNSAVQNSPSDLSHKLNCNRLLKVHQIWNKCGRGQGCGQEAVATVCQFRRDVNRISSSAAVTVKVISFIFTNNNVHFHNHA